MSELDIIDAHFHQWDVTHTAHPLKTLHKLLGWNKSLYRWLIKTVMPTPLVQSLGGVDYISENYLPEDYQKDIGGLNVIAGVFTPYVWHIEKESDLAQETAWVDNLFARSSQRINVQLGAIVGNAKLHKTSDLKEVIRCQQGASQKLVGIRDMLDWSGDEKISSHGEKVNMSRDKQWREGLAILAETGLFFDAFLFHHQLHELADLADLHPSMQFILSHAGTPVGVMGEYCGQGKTEQERKNIRSDWEEGMRSLAEKPNVAVKISGLITPKLGWTQEDLSSSNRVDVVASKLKPLVDHVIDCFGVDRCMFGSHFAPDKVMMSYQDFYAVYKKIIIERPEHEQVALLSGTAKRIYKIHLED